MMKRIAIFTALALFTLGLAGCPSSNGTALQQIATASENAAIIVQEFQNAEIAAHSQGLIPDADHTFIEQQIQTIATLGKTTDTCVGEAASQDGAIACLNTAVNELSTINAQGGTYIKSANAKQSFQAAIAGVQAVLTAIEITLGVTPPTASTPASSGTSSLSGDTIKCVCDGDSTCSGTPIIVCGDGVVLYPVRIPAFNTSNRSL